MARIFYSMAGEGRGHATRARTVIEHLRRFHDVTVFAPEKAWDMLSRAWSATTVPVHRIPGLMFHYRGSKLSRRRTTVGTFKYLAGLPSLIKKLHGAIERQQPDLVLTDFEPALPRAARRAGVPVVSLDHQHFLSVSDLSALPRRLRGHAAMMRRIVQMFYSWQVETIVSSFYFPPLRPGLQNVRQVGVLLRNAVVSARPERDGHVVVYLRRFAQPNVIDSLRHCDRLVHVYGLGEREPEGNLKFHAVSENGFLEHLTTCDALVTNAGNQLVGEALYLGKPVFVMPEDGNAEQEMNAHFLEASGGGAACAVAAVRRETIGDFLRRSEDFCCEDRQRVNGNPAVFDALAQHLPLTPELTKKKTETCRQETKDAIVDRTLA